MASSKTALIPAADVKDGVKNLASLLIDTCDETAIIEHLNAGDVYTAIAHLTAVVVSRCSHSPREMKRDLIEIKKAAMAMAGLDKYEIVEP